MICEHPMHISLPASLAIFSTSIPKSEFFRRRFLVTVMHWQMVLRRGCAVFVAPTGRTWDGFPLEFTYPWHGFSSAQRVLVRLGDRITGTKTLLVK